MKKSDLTKQMQVAVLALAVALVFPAAAWAGNTLLTESLIARALFGNEAGGIFTTVSVVRALPEAFHPGHP